MKILNRLTIKNLKLNKSRTIVTIIGILLSTALVTVVAGMATSLQNTMINAQIKYTGNFDLALDKVNVKQLEAVKNNRDVTNVFVGDELGCAKFENSKAVYRPYVGVKAYEKSAFTDCFCTDIKEGRTPQNSSEIIVSKEFLNSSDKKYTVGDTITLNVGKRVSNSGTPISADTNYEPSSKDGKKSDEQIVDTTSKTYKIVGIMGETPSSVITYDSSSACSTVITCINPSDISSTNSCAFVRFTEKGEKDAVSLTSQITGVPKDLILKRASGELTTQETEAFSKADKFGDFNINSSLITYKGYGFDDASLNMLYGLAAVVLIIIVITSVFVIRNSFAISITEKIKLYGMMSSIGATSKQIRHNVLFEGLILGIIGIPLGLMLGVGVSVLLIWLLNVILGDMLNNLAIAYSIPFLAIIFAVLLSAVTILISTLSSAFKASRISPISAIRENSDVKIKAKKLRSPKIIKKMFGAGGDIAYKNLKRSKKKYRTTVLSIIVSVTLFITMFAFIQYGDTYTKKYYSEIKYSLSAKIDAHENANEQTKKEADSISHLDNIKTCDTTAAINASLYGLSSKLTKNAEDDAAVNTLEDSNGKKCISSQICSVGKNNYDKIISVLGLKYNDVKDKAILLNNYKTGNTYSKIYNVSTGEKVSATDEISGKNISLEIGGVLNSNIENLSSFIVQPGTLIVSDEWIDNNNYPVSRTVMVQSDNSDKLEESIKSLGYTDVNIMNFNKFAKQNNALTLIIEIFTYGFIIVISLIGVTNIFNTITTNMRLRSKEFAMLKSIGMTGREFNKMIRLESLFYGTKSLIIGVPLGILGSILILNIFNISAGNNFSYIFPWFAVAVSVAFVFLIVWLIMKFSIKKVSKQNIIETIRNDNI